MSEETNVPVMDEGEKIDLDEEGNVRELPVVMRQRIKEFVEWANVDKAYEFLHGQDKHESVVVVGTEENPAPHNDIAMALEKANENVNIMIACRVFNTETEEFLDESKILTIKIPRDKLDEILKVEEE